MAIRKLLALAALPLMVLPLAARAAASPPPVPPVPPSSPVEGWDAFVDGLRTLPGRMLARLPEDMRADPQVRQEVARLALESLASSSIEAIAGDGDRPEFLPTIGQVLNIGQPNADTVYFTSRLTPGGTYRIAGRKGTNTLSVIAQVEPGRGARRELDLGRVAAGPDGRFSVLLGPARPAGYTGEWWELGPGVSRLLMRHVSSDWAGERDPVVTIERVDQPPSGARRAAADLAARLAALPRQVDMMALMFVDHAAKLRADGVVNRLHEMTPPGALGSQFYYEGAFDLADDEALVVTSDVPRICAYRSLILTNELYETLDWINAHASLNAAQAAPDSDGRLRIVIAARDPGVLNSLDTGGHRRGVVQGRWTGCDSRPIPEVRKVRLAELAGVLPADVARVTPQEREAIVRERRRAYLERALW